MDASPVAQLLLSRRRLLALAAVTAAGGVFAACGSDGDPGTSSSPTSVPSTSVPSTSTSPSTSPSSTSLADSPTAPSSVDPASAIVVLDEIAALSVLSLGVRPKSVDATFTYASVAAICESIGVTVNAGARTFEAVAADRPSAVIGVSIPTFVEASDNYAQIATTVVVDFSATWQQQAEQIAEALGIEDRAGEIEAKIQTSIDTLKADIATAGRAATTVSVLTGGADGASALSRTGLVGGLISELGLARPAAQDIETSATEPFITVSSERLTDHDADVILILAGPTYPTDTLTQSPLWDQLAAVQAGAAHDVFAEVWFAASAFSVDWILKDIRAAVLADGDIATGEQAVQRWETFDQP